MESAQGASLGETDWALSEELGQSYAQLFERCRGSGGFVSAEEGMRQLQASGLPNDVLRGIWDLSDLDRDRRLSLREFVCALHLAGLARQGRPLPAQVTPEQQEAAARAVERVVASSGSAPFGSSLKPQAGGFSTADTAFANSAFGTQAGSLAFESAGGLHSRALLPELGGRPAGGGAGGLGVSGAGPEGLGQLASVLEVVARLDPEGELRQLTQQVLQVRAELHRQLSRRREYEEELREARQELDAMQEERLRAEVEGAAARQRVAHLQDELGLVEREISAADEDLELLQESHGGRDRGRTGPTPYSSAAEERHDVLSRVRSERELLQADQRSIEEVRRRLEEVSRQKEEAQALQQELLEKQRQTEQDRGLMLTAIEAERNRLSDMRAARIRLCEERRDIQKDMTDIAQERWLATHPRGPPASGGAPPQAQAARGARADGLPPVVYGDGGFGSGSSAHGGGGGLFPGAGAPDAGSSGPGLAVKTDRRGVRS